MRRGTEKRLDVAIVCDKINFTRHGGSNFSIHRLATELVERGHEVEVVTLNVSFENDPPSNRKYEISEAGISGSTFCDRGARLLPWISELARGRDALHVYLPGVIPLFGLWRLAGGGTPVFGTLNTYTTFCTNSTMMADGCWKNCTLRDKMRHSRQTGTGLAKRAPLYAFNTFLSPRLMAELDGLFALSPALRSIHEGAGLSPDNLDVVPNMYDPTFTQTKRARVTTDGGPVRIGYVGRTDPSKGVDILLEAVSRLPDGLKYEVDIVGDDILDYGHDVEYLQDEAERLGVDDKVAFHGWVDHEGLPALYGSFDVFVHPARWPEPFGRTILEAMQHGCAIVSSNTGAPPWIAGEAGATFETGDAQGLSEVLRRLMLESGKRRKMRAACPQELERFRPERVVNSIVSAYRGDA